MYDKRQDMPMFRGCRTFPHRDSMIHLPAKLNVITSQFIRFARSSSMTDLVAACADLVFRMLRHYSGHHGGKIRRMVYRFRHHWHASGAERVGRWRIFYDRFFSELARLLRRR